MTPSPDSPTDSCTQDINTQDINTQINTQINTAQISTALENLIAVVAQLRNPEGGCPWDLAQTPQSLIPYILEEAHEAADALERGETAEIVEELGDLLLQVVLQAQVAQDLGQFTLADVAEGIRAKLIRRHPHVFGPHGFGDQAATVTPETVTPETLTPETLTPAAVKTTWDEIKRQERAAKGLPPIASLSEKLGKYNQTNPPLTAAGKISETAAIAGFEWDCVEDVWAKFEEELAELKEAIADGPEHKAHQQEELGDLLFTLVNLARWYGLDPRAALRGTNQRFVRRFELVETGVKALGDRPLQDYSVAELEALWQAAKQKLAQSIDP